MTSPDDSRAPYVLLESLMADAMRANDPVAAVGALANDERLPVDVRDALRAVDPVGVRTSGLLIAKLRFEHLINGSLMARAWFDRDPGDFAAAFRIYHEECAPTAALPSAEAQVFEAWVAART